MTEKEKRTSANEQRDVIEVETLSWDKHSGELSILRCALLRFIHFCTLLEKAGKRGKRSGKLLHYMVCSLSSAFPHVINPLFPLFPSLLLFTYSCISSAHCLPLSLRLSTRCFRFFTPYYYSPTHAYPLVTVFRFPIRIGKEWEYGRIKKKRSRKRERPPWSSDIQQAADMLEERSWCNWSWSSNW